MEEINYTPVDLMKVYIPGDLVKIYGDVCRVTSVKRRNGVIIDVQVVSPTEHITRCVDFDIVEPLPLSPTILEANGWKKNEYGVYYKNFNPHKAICLSKEDGSNWEVSTGGVTLIHCKFVHDLQHLLFGLGLNSELKV